MSEPEEVETSKMSGSQTTDSKTVTSKDNLSIQQILEGMTNEFNKTGSKKQGPARKINKIESPAHKQDKPQAKAAEESAKTLKAQKCTNSPREENKVVKENIPEKKTEKPPKDKETCPKPEVAKKDGNTTPARIVLTFRTIDENTDHGKKTKISSCPSNLSLVPDEFSNCDQIGGVSVKIENFDEECNDADKSDDKDTCIKNDKKNDELPGASKDRDKKLTSEMEISGSEKSNFSNDSAESSPYTENATDKDTEDIEKSYKGPKINSKKNKDKLLKEYSDESVLKRSARRLSKETFKSTVLESAMARKEKSNYTTETIKRRYNKPGRPRKNFVEKKPIPKLNPPESASKSTPVDVPPKTDSESKKDSVPDLIPTVPPKSNDSPKSVEPPKVTNPPKPTNSPKSVVEKKDLPKLNRIIPQKSLLEKKNSNLPKLSPLKLIKSMSNNVNGTSAHSIPKLTKYAEMPKLTPIIKHIEGMKSKSSESSNSSTSLKNGSLLKNVGDPFLKPHAIKLKRDRAKVSSTDGVKKIHKGNSFSETPSPKSEFASSLEDFALEENAVPAKKSRRSLIPSPSTAEGVASKPESTAVVTKTRTTTKREEVPMQCLCEVRSQLYVTITSADAPLYCTAHDCIDKRIVSCTNEVDHDDVAMRRPSTRIPYIILCRMHKERLIRHNCCPTCGLFCSQGRFVHCSNGHQYHRECELVYSNKPLCPHCGSHNLSCDVIITMTGKRKPINVPAATPSTPQPPPAPASAASSKLVARKDAAARITLPGAGDNSKLAGQTPALKKSTEPLINPDVIRIPEPTVVDKNERFTIMSLFNSVKNGELQKLVNVLACGFNANHFFRDQDQRTGLHLAAERGFLACVHVLVQAGAQYDVLDRNQWSPLMLAAVNGKVEVVRYLMRVGADVTLKGEDGMTALHIAARAGHLEVCKVILSESKVPRTLVDSVDDGGWTSLIWACEFRHVEIAEFLLDNKCDPLIRDAEQNIALHWSAYSGSHEITEMLLNFGCDANVVNIHGDTPLHIASRRDQYSVCVLLLSRGAKIREKNNLKETAIDCCTGVGDTLSVLKLNFKLNQRSENINEKTVKILTNDITRGKESNPVQCVNGVDSEDKPTDFIYVTENCFTSRINVDRTITSLQSCHCEDNCNSDKCLCGNISLRCWYNEEGKLVPEFNYSDPPMLFECNPACDCNKISCNNRVVQHGMTQRFQLFRTDGKGWGLKTLRHITKGTYVCEYVGEIISDSEADVREDDSYLFDLDNRDGETYCIDAKRYGNLARFINHSCSPNLLPVRVYIDHQDLRFPRIAFFANRDINADEELGFDYGDKFWIIKYKSFTCTCGAENCRYSDQTIQITLNRYCQKVQVDETKATAAKPPTT
ncbi:histone-lysine N-methyltransferase EHMT2 [Copidosoma floridanum]|uniref:histone-lysine N-methyltransferase EHMT2 n=1 Tax=Copidosoma floridanum TaxID=29053 RepID=UPI000C6F7710|nr:histone-lysine N-methyltransferase EHMT2 [Copidosoma floridanum]